MKADTGARDAVAMFPEPPCCGETGRMHDPSGRPAPERPLAHPEQLGRLLLVQLR